MRRVFIAGTIAAMLLLISGTAYAATNGVSADHSKGVVLLGSPAGVANCKAAITGAIRYNSTTPRIEFCNGTSWIADGGASPIGALRLGKMSVTAAGNTGTFTADQINVATALNGAFYNLSSYSQAINLATNGAGGMDTGTAPASGFVALYAIYNPATPATSILASAVATSSGSVYSGANMPAGYTASALIGIWPTDASNHLVPGLILDRHFAYQTAVNVMGATNGAGSLTSQSISSGVPAAARAADIVLGSTQASSNIYATVSGDSTGTGAKSYACPTSSATQKMAWGVTTMHGFCTLMDIPMITAQTVYWMDPNINVSDYLYAIGYSF